MDTRSISSCPQASISDTGILTVSFDASGVYTLSVENSFGDTVYSSVLPADGMAYTYILSGIGEGVFTLVLQGPSGGYAGSFVL